MKLYGIIYIDGKSHLLGFLAFLFVLQTFHDRKRHRVMPFHPVEIAGGNPMRRLFSIIMVMA